MTYCSESTQISAATIGALFHSHIHKVVFGWGFARTYEKKHGKPW